MTNSIAPVAFNFNSHEVRTFTDEHQNPWFLANDVCTILGYRNPSKTISDHCKEGGITKRYTPTSSGNQEMTYINEGNLYRLIVKSRKAEAEAFEAWVMEEVLPSIRKTGTYQVKAKPTTKALPNCLTVEQQKAIQALVKSRAESIPDQRKWAGATIKQYSVLKSKFGVGYKEIPESQFSEALNVVARVVIEGEILDAEPKGMKPLKWTKLTDDITSESGYAIISDVKNWIRENLPQEIGCDFFDAMHDLQRVITRSTTEMQEAINHFRVGVGYLNRFRNVK